MNCDVIRDLLPMYADGEASEASRRAIEEHTAGCPACKKLLTDMCMPMEPEPEDRERQILEKLRKKQRRKTFFFWTTILLALIIAVWGVLEARFSGELIYAASTDQEAILKEMPALDLTGEELALSRTILDIPLIRDALSGDLQKSTTLDTGMLSGELASILPENGRFTEVFVMGPSIYISIIAGKQYTCLVYTDSDLTGHIDSISKTLAISPLDAIGEDGYLGEVDTVYELVYAAGMGVVRCQKLKSRHMWFSFLDMP